MIKILLFCAILIQSLFAACEDYLAPECPKCVTCYKSIPIGIYIYYSVNTTYKIPTRIQELTNISRIEIYQPIYKIPTEIGLLVKLTHFSLYAKTIIPGLPTELANLLNLQTLNLDSTNSIISYEREIQPLKYLRRLNIRNEFINSTFPNDLNKNFLTELYFVNLSFYGNLPNLTNQPFLSILDLSYNKFTASIKFDIFPNSLTLLTLNNNALSGSLPLFPNHLNYLDLGFNNLKGNIYDRIGKIAKVKLNNNNFSTISLNPTTIIYLDVSYNILSSNIPASANLKYLDLSYNRFHAVDNSAYFRNASGFLNLAGNRLSQKELTLIERETVLKYPQDVNECLLGTHGCTTNISICLDGWTPRMSYTCGCLTGFKLAGNECIDINECIENNPCNYKLQCINTYGSYKCCGDGYLAIGDSCFDVNECSNNPLNLPNNCSHRLRCVNTNGSFYCSDEG